MAVESYFFSHDYNARGDRKMVALRKKEGMAGVGVYWCIIEMIYEEGGYIALTEIENIGFELRVKPGTIRRIVCDYELFRSDSEKFWSESVLNRLEKRNSKTVKARESARERWNGTKQDANALRTHSDGNAIKERKGEERKGEREEAPSPARAFGEQSENYFIVGGKYPGAFVRVNGVDGLKEYMEAEQSVVPRPEFAEKFMRKVRGNRFNEMMHVKNTFDKFVTEQFK